ncbi:hypothetical protein [Microbacterium terrisoli]|uniref:hypothetical protein n=1 Tax=Microbacterium terrisoli TaxID=3242192 RepID=UPI002805CDF7|nr:hypothetical protein [Microbacterium protaetiae]
MNLDELLAAAAAAPVPHKDVLIPLGVDNGERDALAREREELERRIADATENASRDKRLTSTPDIPTFADEFASILERENALDARDAEHMLTLRVYALPGVEWVALTAKHSNGFGGYDLNTVCLDAAQVNGVAVIDGKESPITEAQWDQLLGRMRGRSVDEIAAAVFELNVADTADEVQRLGKVSRPKLASDSD